MGFSENDVRFALRRFKGVAFAFVMALALAALAAGLAGAALAAGGFAGALLPAGQAYAAELAAASAEESGTCGDDLTWTLSSEGVLTISGEGATTDWGSKSSVPWNSGRGSITKVVVGAGVTSIGKYAFLDCTELAQVEIAANSCLGEIAANAFTGCTALTSVSSTSKVAYQYFKNTLGLEIPLLTDTSSKLNYLYGIGGYSTWVLSPSDIISWVEVPASIDGKPVEGIAAGAFADDTAVRDIAFASGSTLETIEASAFEGCTSLEQFSVPATVTLIDGSAFKSCTSLQALTFTTDSQLAVIGEQAFHGCTSLLSVNVPSSVTAIGEYAFGGVDTVSFPSGTAIDTVTSRMFNGKNSIPGVKHVNLGKGTLAIGDNASAFGSALESVTLPDTFTTFGQGSFKSCSKLAAIAVPDSVTSIGDSAFSGCSALSLVQFTANSKLAAIGDTAFSGCKSLANIDIPTSVTSLGAGAFKSCTALAAIRIPAGVAAINGEAFMGCTALATVEFASPASVALIGESAFENCKALAAMSIPDKVATIGTRAFRNCTALAQLTFTDASQLAAIEGTIDENRAKGFGAFEGCTSLAELVLPASLSYIGPFAFYKCSALENVKLQNASMRFGEFCFIDIADPSLVTVPNETVYSELVENGNFVNLNTSDVYPQDSSLHLIRDATVTILDTMYDVEEGLPNVEVTYDGTKLVENTDYKLSYESAQVAGMSRVLVRGMGDYVGFVRKNFEKVATVVPIPTGVEGLTYNGSAQSGVPSSVSYKVVGGKGTATATEAGTYEATVALVDTANCEWSDGTTEDKTVTWSIARARAIVQPENAGKVFGEKDPSKFTASVTGLVGKDKASAIKYSLSRVEGENAGEYVISSTGDAEQGNYEVQFAAATFTISPRDLSEASVTLSKTSYTYTGKACKPAVTVELDATELVRSVDYTVTYSNNVDAGTASVAVAGKGNYTGMATASFTILARGKGIAKGQTAKVAGATYKAVSASKVYYKKAPKNKKKVVIPAKVKINGKTYKVSGIAPKAFKGTKATKVVVKTKLLKKKTVKRSLTASKVKLVKAPKAKKKAYKKLFVKKIAGRTVKVK